MEREPTTIGEFCLFVDNNNRAVCRNISCPLCIEKKPRKERYFLNGIYLGPHCHKWVFLTLSQCDVNTNPFLYQKDKTFANLKYCLLIVALFLRSKLRNRGKNVTAIPIKNTYCLRRWPRLFIQFLIKNYKAAVVNSLEIIASDYIFFFNYPCAHK